MHDLPAIHRVDGAGGEPEWASLCSESAIISMCSASFSTSALIPGHMSRIAETGSSGAKFVSAHSAACSTAKPFESKRSTSNLYVVGATVARK